MEPKMLAKLFIALSALASLGVGLATGVIFGKNVFETSIIAVGTSLAVYAGIVLLGYFIGLVLNIFFAFMGLSLFFKGKND